jgi:hypothetical protein
MENSHMSDIVELAAIRRQKELARRKEARNARRRQIRAEREAAEWRLISEDPAKAFRDMWGPPGGR